MQLVQKSPPEGYRERAARARRAARHATSRDVCDVLLRLAAKYDELAAAGGAPSVRRDDDEVIVFRPASRDLRSSIEVLYYLD
jgi:hypothetical protein